MSVFFVLSSGRSGSTTISVALSECNNCVCLHHPQPELVVESTEFYYGERSADEIQSVLRDTRPMAGPDTVYGEVNLQLSLLVPILENEFPTCKYLWLTRDGRDVVASMYYRRWYGNPESDEVAALVSAEWHAARLLGHKTGDFDVQSWEALSRFEKCCWLWKKYNEIIESELSGIDPTRWRRVELENLKSSFGSISDFLGINAPKRVWVEKANKAWQPVVAWNEWTTEQRQDFEKHCGSAMDRWYPKWRTPEGKWVGLAHEYPDTPPLRIRSKRFLRRYAGKVVKTLRKLLPV